MSITQRQLFGEVPSKSYACAQVSSGDLDNLWIHTSRFLEETLSAVKAVNIPDLGLFTFTKEDLDIGHSNKTTTTPIFVINSSFQKNYGVAAKKTPVAQSGIPKSDLNLTKIAIDAGLSRDDASTSLKAIIRAAGESVRSGSTVSLDFGFVKLTLGRDGYKTRFGSSFNPTSSTTRKSMTVANSTLKTSIEERSPISSPKRVASPKATSRPMSAKIVSPELSKEDFSESRKAATATINMSQTLNKNRPTQVGNGPRSARSPIKTEKPRSKSLGYDDRLLRDDSFTTTKMKSESFTQREPNQEICDNCRTLDEKNLKRLADQKFDEQIATLTLKDQKKYQDDEIAKLEERQRQRREIDDFNANLKKKATNEHDFHGYLLEKRNEEGDTRERNKKYQADVVDQIQAKRKKEKELEQEKKRELEESNRIRKEAELEDRLAAEKRRSQNLEHKQFLLDQMANSSSKGYTAPQIGTDKDVFMSRLLSTAERKKRQLEDARERKKVQMDHINAKRERTDRQRREEEARSIVERRNIEEQLNKERKDNMDRKKKQQHENRTALEQQMADKYRNKSTAEEDYPNNPFVSRTEAIKEHAKKCKKCGRLIQIYGTANFIRMKEKSKEIH